MDNEMIERVVKALDNAWPENHKEAALKVIKAMREPTEKMINEPKACCYNNGQFVDQEVRRIYIAMIDSITND